MTVEKLLYKCPNVKKKVTLDVEVEGKKKSLLGVKYDSQSIQKCDLQSMGGCNIKIHIFNTKCPAVPLAEKCALK